MSNVILYCQVPRTVFRGKQCNRRRERSGAGEGDTRNTGRAALGRYEEYKKRTKRRALPIRKMRKDRFLSVRLTMAPHPCYNKHIGISCKTVAHIAMKFLRAKGLNACGDGRSPGIAKRFEKGASIMRYFARYTSNTLAAGGSQTLFFPQDPDAVRTGRIFYRVHTAGKYDYSLLFSNIMDSTFSDGAVSAVGNLCDEWTILGMKIYRADTAEPEAVRDRTDLTFGGKRKKDVMPGELFSTDPVCLEFRSGEYLCVEITCRGRMIPCHKESVIPVFSYTGGGFVWDNSIPMPCMVGCNRPVRRRVGFLGDSITQGCGTEVDSYTHWAARVSEMLGTENAYWDLGLGYGRAADAATNGSWLFKAKQNDIVVLCFGVNDLLRGYAPDRIVGNLHQIIRLLHGAGVKVLLQSVPPFEYPESIVPNWYETNAHIRNRLAGEADAFFEPWRILCADGLTPHRPAYGGHPNADGCLLWARALYPVLQELVGREE